MQIGFEELLKICDKSPVRHGPPKDETIRYVYECYQPWFERFREGDLELKKNLDGMSLNNLSEEEAFFILAYSSSCSRWLNRSLWVGEKLCDCKKAFANSLKSSLEKMPSYNGVVFRMDSYPGDEKIVGDWFKKNIGKTLSTPCFLSTAKEDYENTEVVWKIRTLQNNSFGKDINNLCQAPLEVEVLFLPNATFRIIGIEKDTNYILLDELDPLEKADFPLIGHYYED